VALAVSAEVTVTDLRVENMTSPLGLDTNQPRFSWKIVSDEQNVVQTAYEIVVDYLRRRPSSQWPILRMDANDNVNDNVNPNAQHSTLNAQH
jgi:alpha-L-rhamnosidase